MSEVITRFEDDRPRTTPVMVPMASASCAQVCAALAAAQGEFGAIEKTKTADIGTYSYKYAPLDKIISVIREPMAKHGLGRQQYLVSKGDQAFIRSIVWHSSGEWIASDYPVFPTKDGAQGFASGVTYARRYGLCLVLGLAPEDEDDDGVSAEGKPAARPARRPTARQEPTRQPAPETAHTHEAGPGSYPTLDEQNGTRWLKNLDALLAQVGEVQDVVDLRGDSRVEKAIKAAPTAIRMRIEDIFREAYARLGEPDFVDAETGLDKDYDKKGGPF